MNETKLVNVKGKGPVKKSRFGRFEVSAWHWKKVIPPREEHRDLFSEREYNVHRASIRYSKWNRSTQEWAETTIWCSIDELRSLVQALDQLGQEGED